MVVSKITPAVPPLVLRLIDIFASFASLLWAITPIFKVLSTPAFASVEVNPAPVWNERVGLGALSPSEPLSLQAVRKTRAGTAMAKSKCFIFISYVFDLMQNSVNKVKFTTNFIENIDYIAVIKIVNMSYFILLLAIFVNFKGNIPCFIPLFCGFGMIF
jgi:hypothetical protein